MVVEQLYVLSVIAITLGLFIWGKWRYDIIALSALVAVVLGGVITANQAFEGFSHPALITVAAVLVISRCLQNSGIIGWLVRFLELFNFGPSGQVAAVSALVALLSGFMNNVGALALLLPVIMQIARKCNRAPGELLMPLAFGSLLGGLTTMVGTPPNIIVANMRSEAVGTPFGMFDFTPVGLLLAIFGIIFISLLGWRLVPIRGKKGSLSGTFDAQEYVTEVFVPQNSGLSGKKISDVLEDSGEHSISVIAIFRKGKKIIRPSKDESLRIKDHLLIEGKSDFVEVVLHNTPLELVGNQDLEFSELENQDSGVIEVVVKPGSFLAKKSADNINLEQQFGLHLLAVARHGRSIGERLRNLSLRPGDTLLLQGDMNTISGTIKILGCLPLRERDIALHRKPTLIPLCIFIIAVLCSIFSILSTPVAFTAAVVCLVLSNQISARELYDGVDWPVIVLLGAMGPVGMAMEVSGVNNLLATQIAVLAGVAQPWCIVALVLVTAMVLSDIINNAATAILMSQLSIRVAEKMDISVDPLLMAVAVGSSCAFLTPIGHQSNILVMGPGGYRFGDYWRMGLPLEVLIAIIAVPTILKLWPV